MKRVALFVGNNRSQDPAINPLLYAEADATEWYSFFKHKAGYGEVRYLLAADAEEVLETAKTLVASLVPGDLFLFGFAGHGYALQGRHLLLCPKARLNRLQYFQQTVPIDLLQEETERPGVDRVFLIDSCRTDLLRDRGGSVGLQSVDGLRDIVGGRSGGMRKAAGSFTLLCACDEGQQAREVPEFRQGLFSKAVLEELDWAVRHGQDFRLDDAWAEALGGRMSQLASQVGLPACQRPWIKRSGTVPVLLAAPMPASPPVTLSASAGVVVGEPVEVSKRPSSCLLGQIFVNTLGMKFVPVPGSNVWFSIWITRVQDYECFVASMCAELRQGMKLPYSAFHRISGAVGGREWREPGFAQGPYHPVVNVSWEDANAFCAWLTEKERQEGKLGPSESYRLPSDQEWSAAVGLGPEIGATPREKDGQIRDAFPWGDEWPAPRGAGNYGPNLGVDIWEKTSPVGLFEANQYGLFDMGGNVWEWCEDEYCQFGGNRVLRGASWRSEDRNDLLSSNRIDRAPSLRFDRIGFRIVLAGVSAQ